MHKDAAMRLAALFAPEAQGPIQRDDWRDATVALLERLQRLLKPRSLPQHRRHFGVIKALLAHWPETHPFKPDDAEHLRAWLYVKAGYRRVRHIDVNIANPKELAIALALAETILRTAKVHGFPRVHEQALVIFLPKSIAWDKLSHKAFCELDQDVSDVIKAETGLDPDQVLKETEAAA